MARPKRSALCHPDRPHSAKGLCRVCYQHHYITRRKLQQYGITQAQLTGFKERARGVCPLCRIPSNRLTAYRVHKKAKVAGVVCWFCRQKLWQIGSLAWLPHYGPSWLRRAVRLMERSLGRSAQETAE